MWHCKGRLAEYRSLMLAWMNALHWAKVRICWTYYYSSNWYILKVWWLYAMTNPSASLKVTGCLHQIWQSAGVASVFISERSQSRYGKTRLNVRPRRVEVISSPVGERPGAVFNVGECPGAVFNTLCEDVGGVHLQFSFNCRCRV